MIPVTGSTVRSIVSTLITCDVAGFGYFCHMPRMTRDHSCLKADRKGAEAKGQSSEGNGRGGCGGPQAASWCGWQVRWARSTHG